MPRISQIRTFVKTINMKCPHCLNGFHGDPNQFKIGVDIEGIWTINSWNCPVCKKSIFQLVKNEEAGFISFHEQEMKLTPISETYIRPRQKSRYIPSPEIPSNISTDYIESCLVLADSPKASAALSRRCLQNIIHNKLKIAKPNLFEEIQYVIENNLVSKEVAEHLDAIRTIGNFATHPIKSTNSGEIIEVEPDEAEYNLEVLEMLFDHLYDKPAYFDKKKEALNLKLKNSGKRLI